MTKKNKDAYYAGTNGEGLPDKAGRVARVLHRIGRRQHEQAEAYNKALYEREMRVLEEATSVAQGMNKTALEIIRLSADIPNQAATWPASSRTELDGKTEKLKRVYWMGDFGHGVVNEKVAIKPTMLVEPLAALKIGNVDMPGISVDTPISRVMLISTRNATDDGQLGDVTTEIYLNWGSYDPNDSKKYGSTTVESAKIRIDASGKVAGVGLAYEGGLEGYIPQDMGQTTVNAEEILETLKTAVGMTADAYGRLSDI